MIRDFRTIAVFTAVFAVVSGIPASNAAPASLQDPPPHAVNEADDCIRMFLAGDKSGFQTCWDVISQFCITRTPDGGDWLECAQLQGKKLSSFADDTFETAPEGLVPNLLEIHFNREREKCRDRSKLNPERTKTLCNYYWAVSRFLASRTNYIEWLDGGADAK